MPIDDLQMLITAGLLAVVSSAVFIDRDTRSTVLGSPGHSAAQWMMILVGLYILSDSATDVV